VLGVKQFPVWSSAARRMSVVLSTLGTGDMHQGSNTKQEIRAAAEAQGAPGRGQGAGAAD